HLAITTEQGGARAEHELFYRAPQLTRGVVLAPERVAVAFDGRRFYRLRHDVKKLEVYEVKLSPPRAAYFLASTFTPFVPEGYRAPLLPSTGITARRVVRSNAPQAVELSATVEGIPHTWLFRWPAVDLLEKRVGETVLTVDAESCDGAKGFCVPTRVTQRRSDGAVEASTTVTRVELDAKLPNDGFQLTAPDGYATENHVLVDEEAAPR
ncbi:MAG: hypothetical protein JNG84_04340, partial [Archangium sp.]|nr:hypothetical protein [Archangium sp.]